MFELASKRILEKEDQFIRLEKAINPLLDDNDKYDRLCLSQINVIQSWIRLHIVGDHSKMQKHTKISRLSLKGRREEGELTSE